MVLKYFCLLSVQDTLFKAWFFYLLICHMLTQLGMAFTLEQNALQRMLIHVDFVKSTFDKIDITFILLETYDFEITF